MKMRWKGVDSTFKNVFRRQDKTIKENTDRVLAIMLMQLEAATPKDTGYATSRWRIAGLFPRFRVENDAGYIEHLNSGSSNQAPSFFVESIVLRFGKPFGQVVTVQPSNPGS